MNTAGRKNKGRSGQNEVKDLLLQGSGDLLPEDIRTASMGAPGKDVLFSPKAQQKYPWSVEVKFHKRLAACRVMEQAEANAEEDDVPVAFFRENRGKWYASVEAEYLLYLIEEIEFLKKDNRNFIRREYLDLTGL